MLCCLTNPKKELLLAPPGFGRTSKPQHCFDTLFQNELQFLHCWKYCPCS